MDVYTGFPFLFLGCCHWYSKQASEFPQFPFVCKLASGHLKGVMKMTLNWAADLGSNSACLSLALGLGPFAKTLLFLVLLSVK